MIIANHLSILLLLRLVVIFSLFIAIVSKSNDISVGSRQRLRSATRSDLVVSSSATLLGSRAFAVAGPKAWNQLPAHFWSLETRVVNNTFWKYWQYQYKYLSQKVLPIPIAIPYEKSIANSDTNTFWPILFSARQHICYSALYAIARPSACLSVRPSVCPSHGWISQRRLNLGSRNLHHRVAPWL